MTEDGEANGAEQVEIHALTKELSAYIDTSILSDPAHTVTAETQPPEETSALAQESSIPSTPELQPQNMGDLAALDDDFFGDEDDLKIRTLACFEDENEAGKEQVTILRETHRDHAGNPTGDSWYSVNILQTQTDGQSTLTMINWYPNGATNIREHPATLRGKQLFDERGGNASFGFPADVGNSTFSFHEGDIDIPGVPKNDTEAQNGARERLRGLSQKLKTLADGKHFSPGNLEKAANEEADNDDRLKITRPPTNNAAGN